MGRRSLRLLGKDIYEEVEKKVGTDVKELSNDIRLKKSSRKSHEKNVDRKTARKRKSEAPEDMEHDVQLSEINVGDISKSDEVLMNSSENINIRWRQHSTLPSKVYQYKMWSLRE